MDALHSCQKSLAVDIHLAGTKTRIRKERLRVKRLKHHASQADSQRVIDPQYYMI